MVYLGAVVVAAWVAAIIIAVFPGLELDHRVIAGIIVIAIASSFFLGAYLNRGFPADTISAGDYTIISAEKRKGEIILLLENKDGKDGEVRLYALPQENIRQVPNNALAGTVWVARGGETIKMYVKTPSDDTMEPN